MYSAYCYCRTNVPVWQRPEESTSRRAKKEKKDANHKVPFLMKLFFFSFFIVIFFTCWVGSCAMTRLVHRYLPREYVMTFHFSSFGYQCNNIDGPSRDGKESFLHSGMPITPDMQTVPCPHCPIHQIERPCTQQICEILLFSLSLFFLGSETRIWNEATSDSKNTSTQNKKNMSNVAFLHNLDYSDRFSATEFLLLRESLDQKL